MNHMEILKKCMEKNNISAEKQIDIITLCEKLDNAEKQEARKIKLSLMTEAEIQAKKEKYELKMSLITEEQKHAKK